MIQQLAPLAMPSLNQPIAVRLDSTNHLLWQNQMLNIIIAHGLKGFIDGSTPCPPQFLDAQRQQPKTQILFNGEGKIAW